MNLIAHLWPNSSFKALGSRFAFPNTMNGFNFFPFACAVQQTETRTFLWPIGTCLSWCGKSCIKKHVRPYCYLIHGNYTFRSKGKLFWESTTMHYISYKSADQLWRIFLCYRGLFSQWQIVSLQKFLEPSFARFKPLVTNSFPVHCFCFANNKLSWNSQHMTTAFFDPHKKFLFKLHVHGFCSTSI